MKRTFLSTAASIALCVGMVACSNSTDDKAKNDSTSTTTTTTETSTATSTGNYAALADTVERNSEQGYYLNPKTGKPYGKLKVDRTTGHITTEAGEPVWRYVDRRNWWVYGGDNWDTIGQAKMEGDKLMYQDQSDKWVDYDTRWKADDETNIKKYKESDNGSKQKMVTEEGDKIKTKTDEEGNTKIKVNDQKMKVDSNGNLKKH